jgi:hypothetical protein
MAGNRRDLALFPAKSEAFRRSSLTPGSESANSTDSATLVPGPDGPCPGGFLRRLSPLSAAERPAPLCNGAVGSVDI